MILDNLIYNYKIHCLLRKYAKQRITAIIPNTDIWLIEYAVEDNNENNNLLLTCQMRGWVEPLKEGMPKGRVNDDGSLPDGPMYDRIGTLWKLTDSGWAAINRNHQLVVLSIFLSVIGTVISLKIF